MITHDYFIKLTRQNQHVPSKISIMADTEYAAEITVEKETSDKKILLNINPEKLKSILLITDRDMSIDVNAADIPDETIFLKGGIPFLWFEGCGHANPFEQRVTEIYASNSGVHNGTLTVCIAQDSE